MLDHPMVVADVQNPHQPKTATGVIVEALARRKAAGLPAFTVMSCDNMPENGHVMRDVVTSYAQAIDVKLAQWIEDNIDFPINNGGPYCARSDRGYAGENRTTYRCARCGRRCL
ncbi:hypothetical protein OH693_05550 [Escherichia coli]|nr:hypothetical protein [Escherichia coli]